MESHPVPRPKKQASCAHLWKTIKRGTDSNFIWQSLPLDASKTPWFQHFLQSLSMETAHTNAVKKQYHFVKQWETSNSMWFPNSLIKVSIWIELEMLKIWHYSREIYWTQLYTRQQRIKTISKWSNHDTRQSQKHLKSKSTRVKLRARKSLWMQCLEPSNREIRLWLLIFADTITVSTSGYWLTLMLRSCVQSIEFKAKTGRINSLLN